MIVSATRTFSHDPDGHFVSTNSMDHRNEDSESSWKGLLPEASLWNSFWLAWDQKILPSQSVINLFTKTNLIHIYHKFWLSKPLKRCVLMLSCWKYCLEDTHTHLAPGSTFHPYRNAVATDLSFINTICTRFELIFPILMEKSNNHQITLPKGWIGFSSLDMVIRDEAKH